MKNLPSRSFLKLAIVAILLGLAAWLVILFDEKKAEAEFVTDRSVQKQLEEKLAIEVEQRRENFIKKTDALQGCVSIQMKTNGEVCENRSGDFGHCLDGFDTTFLPFPICAKWDQPHTKTPESVKAIYMSAFVAGNGDFRESLFSLIDQTELNAVIIDVKEVDGLLTSAEFSGIREEAKVRVLIPDLKDLLRMLSDRGIYTIARIVVFKDAHMVDQHPEWAVKRSDQKTVWADYGGKKYIDPGARESWRYIVDLASRSYEIGFDEINLDYIRFPSDGNMADAWYPHSQERIDANPTGGKSAVLTEFGEYFHKQLRSRHPEIVTSADVFGMVTTNTDDLTIGQVLEPFIRQYDYVAPMVYPSHYPSFFLDLPGHPDNHPYEVVNYSMKIAAERAEKIGEGYSDKLRPWLQDFTCTWCAGYFPYGAAEVREQINGTYDAGLDSWFLWDASNTYTRGALLSK